MGILKDSMNGNTPDPADDPEKREEDYEKLYMKIARDFVHKDDLKIMLLSLINLLRRSSITFDAIFETNEFSLKQESAALQKAIQYKIAMDDGLDLVKLFASNDLIKLDE